MQAQQPESRQNAQRRIPFLFHYRCLLTETGLYDWSRCRNSAVFCRQLPYFADLRRKCRTGAVIRRLSQIGAKSDEYVKAEQPLIAATTDRLAQTEREKARYQSWSATAIWLEIRAAIAEGQRLATTRRWLEEKGGIIVTTVQSLGPISPASAEKNERLRWRRLQDQGRKEHGFEGLALVQAPPGNVKKTWVSVRSGAHRRKRAHLSSTV